MTGPGSGNPSAWLSVERFLEPLDDGVHDDDHELGPLTQRVLFDAKAGEVLGRQRLAQRYIDGQVGIRYEVQARPPSGHAKRRHLTLFFERSVGRDDYGVDCTSLRRFEKRVLVGGPGRDRME